jgi:hypothetical protein
VQKRGIPDAAIDAFDIAFESEREQGRHADDAEPGDDARAPYYLEHQFASRIERAVALELGVKLDVYDKTVMSL